MRPGKRLAPGDRIVFGKARTAPACWGGWTPRWSRRAKRARSPWPSTWPDPTLDAAIAERGAMPLPPYIAAKRPEDAQDRADYQTVYAGHDPASVAAPMAGLHFTPELLERLQARGVSLEFVTLHVGAGTFLPVKTEDLSEHRMHAEFGGGRRRPRA